MRLSDLKSGQSAVILKVLGHGAFRKRVMEMGFVKGREITAILSAPLNDPVKYRLMNYEVSLRRSEAAMIEVVPVEEAREVLPPPHVRTAESDVHRGNSPVEEKEIPQNAHGNDHALFAGYAPADRPRYVAVAVVEAGEHGSSVASPIVGQVLSYLLVRDFPGDVVP